MDYEKVMGGRDPLSLVWLAAGIGIGAAGYALLDPRRGAARRHLLRDKALSQKRELAERTQRRATDLKWRAKGAVHEARARRHEEDVPDHILAERVRAQMGRPVSHPGALEVRVENGKVFLSGPILAHEVDDLLARVKKVRGVKDIQNDLQPHVTPDNIPSLQGEGSRQSRG